MEKTVVARWVRPLEVPEASQDVGAFFRENTAISCGLSMLIMIFLLENVGVTPLGTPKMV
jgi:hypothetical protein